MAKNISSDTNSIMEKLLASSQKVVNLRRGQEIEGEIVSITDSELILDLGAKSEGVIQKRELSSAQIEKFKVGTKIKAFVIFSENENGQVVLSLHQAQPKGNFRRGGREINWSRFKNAQTQESKLTGVITEINKGGLIVEIERTRGFLPNSQVGFDLLSNLKQGLETLIGQTVNITVTEVNIENNRLIFSQRGQISDDILSKLKAFKKGQQVTGSVVAILPFGLVIDLDGVEGLVFISDISWETVENLESLYKVGQEVEAQVIGIDEDLGRVNLSIKHLIEDPFTKIAEKYPADEMVRGQISAISEAGIIVKLEDAEGFLPASKMEPGQSYETGKSIQMLVDSVDMQRRRINLAPLITSTEGLIYK